MAAPFDPRALATPVQQATQQAAQQAWERVPPGAKEAVGQRLSQSLAQSRESWQGAKAQLSEQITQRSEQARQGATGVSDSVGSLLNDRLGQPLAERLHQVQGWFSLPVQHWLEEHRVIGGVVAHPILSAIALLLLAILSLNLLKVMLNPRNWITLLSLPWRLAKLGLGLDEETLYFEQTLQPGNLRKGEVDAILRRLEALNKEQEILHGQLKDLLSEEAQKTKISLDN
jgi:hypothetical protein